MSEFHFIRPQWLWALLLVLPVLYAFIHRKRSQSNWQGIIDPQLMPFVLRGNPSQKQRWPVFLIGFIGLLSVFALAGPTWVRLPTPVFQNQAALIIALDLSLSMESQDLKPSRIARARHKISDILKRRQEGQTALVAYAAQAFTVTPLTQDTETILLQVQDLSSSIMPAQGSRPDLALKKALALFKQSHIREGEVLLITDGIETNNINSSIQQLTQAGHRLLILGVGTPEGAPITQPGGGFVTDTSGSIVIPKLNEPELAGYAQSGNGLYHRITANDQDINTLLNTNEMIDTSIDTSEIKTDTWEDAGFWLLLLIIPLSLPAFRKGILSLLLLCFLITPSPKNAYAISWDSLWLNQNQQAKQAFIQQQHEQAAEQFSDPNWKAAALYRAGQYQAAIDALKDINNADTLYNKGNAHAKLGQLQEAINSYEQALQLDPEHEDAKHNRDLLKDLQQQQQQQNNQQDNNDSQNQQQDQTKQNQQQQQNDLQQENSAQEQTEQDQAENNPQPQDSQQSEAEQQALQDQEKEESQQAQPQKQDSSQPQEEQAQQSFAESEPLSEEQQATEQWIRRIPDDPGGLLRRKFKYQYQQQKHKSEKQKW